MSCPCAVREWWSSLQAEAQVPRGADAAEMMAPSKPESPEHPKGTTSHGMHHWV